MLSFWTEETADTTSSTNDDFSTNELNLSNIIKLLIPAEFLQIESLWQKCIEFIGQNIEAITKMKINMGFL